MPQNTNEIIADQNDRFRRGDSSITGKVLIASELQALLDEHEIEAEELVSIVSQFDEFTEDNDPHREHDFGQFTIAETSCYWKIDLYDPDLVGYSKDPTNPDVTVRVLTIMRAADY